MTNPSRSLLLVATGLLVGGIATLGFMWWESDPQGEPNKWCDRFEGSSLANGKGLTVSWHTTACTTLGTSVVSYVYVHPSADQPTASHLVLRYSQRGAGNALKAAWLSERHVVLEVDDVSDISKMQTTAGPVSIDYKITSDVKGT